MVGDVSTLKLLELFQKWKACQPLSLGDETRLWRKLRLDWNFHSNHIEGNTLSYGETELLLIHGQTHGSHELRDYEEMKAHDLAIHHLREIAPEKRPVTEVEIRTLNQIILKEPFWTRAITTDGAPTQKQVMPGQYKISPNSVRTATGEIFEFATPLDVPMKMETLVQKLNECIQTELSDLPGKLAYTHHEFLLIHPFDDGNGRVARLILNYILMIRGLLPIVIPSPEKEIYLSALRQADVGIFDSLENYFAEKIKIALELGITAGCGGKIEELTDIEKEISLFVRQQETKLKPIIKYRNLESLSELYRNFIRPLLTNLDDKTKIFEKVFRRRHVELYAPAVLRAGPWQNQLDHLFESSPSALLTELRFTIIFEKSKSDNRGKLYASIVIQFWFKEDEFELEMKTYVFKPKIIRAYSDFPPVDERDTIIEDLLKDVFHLAKLWADR
jgi:Fic family protein